MPRIMSDSLLRASAYSLKNINMIFTVFMFYSAYWCRLLITFANSLDSDQDRQNVGPDLDLNCLTRCCIPERFDKVDFEKICIRHKSMKTYPVGILGKELTSQIYIDGFTFKF